MLRKNELNLKVKEPFVDENKPDINYLKDLFTNTLISIANDGNKENEMIFSHWLFIIDDYLCAKYIHFEDAIITDELQKRLIKVSENCDISLYGHKEDYIIFKELLISKNINNDIEVMKLMDMLDLYIQYK